MSKIKTQLAVIGGGPAGVCGALTAARRGIDTVLVTNRPVLGGNSSSEIRVWTRGATGGGNFYGEEMGVWGELKLTNLYRNPDGNPVFWDEVLLDAVLKEERLQLLLNTDVCDLIMDGGRILSVLGKQQGTEKSIELEADVFLDATGDGVLGALSGVPYYMGRDYISSRSQKISSTPELQGCSILFCTKEEDHPIPFVAPDYAYSIDQIAKIVGRGGRVVSEKMGGSDCWWFEYGGSRNTIRDLQEITLELKRLVMGVWNYIKNSGKFDASNGYMKGVSDTLFDVQGSVTRGQLVTILYRVAGEPSVEGLVNPFQDVANDTWYTDAVIWAASEGIVKGVSETEFAPNAKITREQIVTILYRYDGEKAVSEDKLAAFTDAASVGNYAVDAMNWAIANGIVNGMTETTLAPTATATRAQMAVILKRFMTE